MITFSQGAYKDTPEKYGMSRHLDVEPRSTVQLALLSLDFCQDTMKTIMDDMEVGILRRAATQSRVNNLGKIGGQSGLINSDAQTQILKFRLEFLKSQAAITDLENAEIQSKKQAALTDLNVLLAEAPHWYNNGNMESGRFPKKFTKRCAKAVITLMFNEKVAMKMKRADMIALIKSQLDQKPTAIHDATVKHAFSPH
jgi:hypothetical protein